MKLYRTIAELGKAGIAGSSMCIGVFDGVHRGHQMLIAASIQHARRLGLPSLALTFANHPLSLLAPPYAPPILTGPEEKAALLDRFGIDLCLMLDFDAALAATAPRDFLRDAVAGVCQARHLVCGRDFRFGAKGAGDVALLESAGAELGFAVEIRDDLLEGNQAIRSSRIRARLIDGDVAGAAILLGHPYALSGTVVDGDHRGRSIGFPTANLAPPAGRLIPRNGVYAVQSAIGGRSLRGMLNIGVRPTFQPGERTVEAHLFDFSEDLYGQELRVEFLRRIRDERRFASVDELIAQLRRDEIEARAAI